MDEIKNGLEIDQNEFVITGISRPCKWGHLNPCDFTVD